MAISLPPDPVLTGRAWAREVAVTGPVGFAPGRVNLIGEHLDYNGGASLPIAIPYWTFAAAEPSSDPGLTIESQGHPGYRDTSPATESREPTGEWWDYVLGVIEHLRGMVDLPPGLGIRIHSTLPHGAGLSSSASLTIATATVLDRLAGRQPLGRDVISQVSRAAENDFVGAPTGDLDQCAILGARPGYAVLCRPGAPPARHLPWDPESVGHRLLVIATGVRHALADGGYASRVEQCRSAARRLGVQSLSDPLLTLQAVEGLEDDLERRRARHVVTETARVDAFAVCLDRGDLGAVGSLMLESHASLRDDFEVSCEELDLVVESACAAGANGARMTGGGFGGSAIALVPTHRTDAVVTSVRAAFADRGLNPPSILDGRAVGRAGSFSA